MASLRQSHRYDQQSVLPPLTDRKGCLDFIPEEPINDPCMYQCVRNQKERHGRIRQLPKTQLLPILPGHHVVRSKPRTESGTLEFVIDFVRSRQVLHDMADVDRGPHWNVPLPFSNSK